ncbi:MAG: hypothetical protein JWO58_1728 [Chitinophagaceae bacterium]|nr:hypothetical protein [Chitinophagaceae bacterium]
MPQLIKNLSELLKQVFPYTKSIVGFVVILTLCWLPKSTVQEPSWFHIPNADKAVHFALFFVWAFCLQLDCYKKIPTRIYLLALILFAGTSTAVLTEALQPIVSNRTRDWLDAVFDLAGTLAAGFVFPFSIKKKSL